MTAAALKQHKENPDVSTDETTVNGKVISKDTGPTVMFGPGGTSDFLDLKVPDDGRVIASFCVVQEHGAWKVHCVYFGNQTLQGENKDFIVRNLAEFAKGK